MIEMLLSDDRKRVRRFVDLVCVLSCACKFMLGMAGGYEYCYIEDMILILEQLFKMQMEVEEPLLPLNNKT